MSKAETTSSDQDESTLLFLVMSEAENVLV